MIQHPAILALTISSIIISAMIGYASWFGIQIIERWNLASGTEQQLALERKTYLISVILTYSLVFQILSFFLYIFTTDALHSQFTGAMCAAGSLAVNSYGYPVAILKVVNCLMAGVWLIINHIDTKGYDYPLIKHKYRMLNIFAPLVLLEALFQFVYFFNLKADIITSCCGSLFSSEKRSIAGQISALPPVTMQWVFIVTMMCVLLSGIHVLIRKKGALLFSLLSIGAFAVSIISLVSFISLYFYELPTHHCPFCILQTEYHYIGYLLYALLLVAGISASGTGILASMPVPASISNQLPGFLQKLVVITIGAYSLFTVITIIKMLTTSFRLD